MDLLTLSNVEQPDEYSLSKLVILTRFGLMPKQAESSAWEASHAITNKNTGVRKTERARSNPMGISLTRCLPASTLAVSSGAWSSGVLGHLVPMSSSRLPLCRSSRPDRSGSIRRRSAFPNRRLVPADEFDRLNPGARPRTRPQRIERLTTPGRTLLS